MKIKNEKLLEEVVQFVAKAYKIDPATLNRNTDFQKDLELDSMSLVQSIVEIEEAYGVEIPEKRLFKIHTIGDIVDFLEEALPPRQVASA